MKKLFTIIAILLISVSAIAQKTQKSSLILEKTTTSLHLKGVGGYLNFNNADITIKNDLTDSLTITGADWVDFGNANLVNGDSVSVNSIRTVKFDADTIITDTLRAWSMSVHELRVTGGMAITLDSTATVWDDLMFPVQNLKTVGTTAKPDYDVVGQTLDFPEDTTEAVGFVVQMPHSWKEGSTIYPHVHWLRSAADSVDWRFRYKWFNIGAALPGTWTEKILSHNTQTWTTGTIQELSRSVNGVGLSGAGKGISSILVVKFYRRSDALTGDAKLLQIDIHYEMDAIGSRTETAK